MNQILTDTVKHARTLRLPTPHPSGLAESESPVLGAFSLRGLQVSLTQTTEHCRVEKLSFWKSEGTYEENRTQWQLSILPEVSPVRVEAHWL